eukprot:12188927-Ditylum_brightwellii.AAC.1
MPALSPGWRSYSTTPQQPSLTITNDRQSQLSSLPMMWQQQRCYLRGHRQTWPSSQQPKELNTNASCITT